MQPDDAAAVDAELALRPTRHAPHVYAVERAAHDGRAWVEHVGDRAQRYMTSAKICDADVQGSADELLELASAIGARGEFAGHRCAVRVAGDRAWLWSPADPGRAAVVPLARADALAAAIAARLG